MDSEMELEESSNNKMELEEASENDDDTFEVENVQTVVNSEGDESDEYDDSSEDEYNPEDDAINVYKEIRTKGGIIQMREPNYKWRRKHKEYAEKC